MARTIFRSVSRSMSTMMASSRDMPGSYTTSSGLFGFSVLMVATIPVAPFESCTMVPGGYTPRQRMNTCSSLGSNLPRFFANISDSASCGVRPGVPLTGLHRRS